METLPVVCKAVSAAAQVVPAGSQAKTAFWGSHSSELVLTDNAEDNPRIINDAVGVLLSYVKDSYKMESSETCEEWISQVKDFVAEYDKISKESYFWSPSSLDSRKQRRKMFDKIKELMQKKYEMMIDPSLESVVKSSRAPDISRFRTLQEPLEQTLVLLEDDKTKGICIHGTVGIGKTTILRNLNNHEQVATNFDIVIWLKVSKEESEENLSREHLQQDIVQRLKLNIGDTSNAREVARKISMVLEHKRYLLLLDDVKDYLDLSEIGIPESNNRSKIVLTTRLLNDCYKMVDRPILVERLSEVDAWRMFQDVLDEPKLIENRKTMQVAKKLCKGCGRLPLVIEKVAKIFKWKAKDDLWVDGLNSWRGLAARECQGIRELYELLKQFCYDSLDDDQCKNCFLYCALYPEDTDINKNDLLECWEANNLLFNGNSTTNGNSILDYLQKLSILEEGKSMDHVKMDKFIRQVAVYVTEVYPEHRHLVKASKVLKQPPDVKLWGEMNRISLGDNELKQLPDSPNCPMLSTLFLQKNLCLEKIDPSFFKNMKKLGVLDLSHTGLRLLPSSISSLDSLKILYLVGCKGLSDLPSDIDGLKQLETLDIRENGFNNIPLQIEKLSCLRRLRVSFTVSGNESVHLNYDIISKLPKLEELIIDVNSVEELPNEMVDNIIEEVATLQQFKSLKICLSEKVAVVIEVKSSRSLYICSPETAFALYLRKNSSWRDAISAFEFYIGCQSSEVSQFPKFLKYDKYIKYCNGASSSFPFLEALAKANAFELVNHKNIKQLSDFGIASMNMQGCLIESCDAIETIVGDSAVLPNVEHLFLKDLPNLKSIWKGPGPTKLMTLDLFSCQNLVEIFSDGVIQQLHEVQYLKIGKCQKIKEIIAESDADRNPKVLPKLKELILLDMPKLRSVCAIESLEWGSLEKIEILKCPILLKLPFNKDNAAKLETIEAEQEWWEKLQWQNDEVKERLQKLCTLRDAKERLVTEGGGNTSSEITEEHSVSSENCESSAKEYLVSQPQETSCCSKSQPEINIEVPSTNSECVNSLKDDPEAIRSLQNFMSHADPETLAAVTASNMIGKISPAELQSMFQLASSFQGENPYLKRGSSDSDFNGFTPGRVPTDVAPDMLKMACDMMSNMSAEDLQNMFQMASSLKRKDSNGLGSDTKSKPAEDRETFAVRADHAGESSSSHGLFSNSRATHQSSFLNPTADVQEQMQDPAMRQFPCTGLAGGMEEDLEGHSLVHLGRSSPPSSSGRSSIFGPASMSSGTLELENSALKKMALERDGELSLAEYERLKEMEQKARDKTRFSPLDEEFLEKLEGKGLSPIVKHYFEEVLFAVAKQKWWDSLSPEEQEFKSIELMTNRLKLDSKQWNKEKDLLIYFILSYPMKQVADQVDCFHLCEYTSKLNPLIRTLEAALKKKDIQILRDNLTELNDLLETSWKKFCMPNFSSELEVYLPRDWSLHRGQLKFCSYLSFPVYGKPDCPEVILNRAITSSICLVSRCIMEERMKLIAISGHGAGKAVKALKDIPEIQSKFDVVLYICVSQHHSNEEVQMDITKQIHGHEFPPGTDILLPLDELLKPCNFLLMLDFIDGRIIDLYNLKIPFDHGCIVLATKSNDIYQIISVDLEVRMEYHLLQWELFCWHVGHVFHSSSTLLEMAIRLIEECHGHLLATILLARALKDVTDVGFWELALNELMLQPSSQVEEGMNQVMARVLKFIWKSKGNITKRCIGHCTTYREGRTINEASLISCWLKDCLVETKEEGEVILADLIDSCLLEHFDGDLRMREETRIVLSKQIMPYMGSQLTEGWMVKWNAERINLIDNGVSELPESPICSNLVFLFLQKNCDLMVIPSLFFECMPMLQVLDLSYTSIKTLPASISRLVSLQKLLLRGCELFTELPPEVGELSILQVLDMEGTEIMYLPEEIKELKNLLLLKLSFYGYGNSYRESKQISKMIPRGVLSDLFLLKELSIDVNPEAEEWIADLKDIIYELQNLRRLTKLKLYLPKVELLKQLTVSSFRFTVGRHEQRMISRLPHEVEEEFKKHEISLRYINGEHIPTEIKKTLKRTSAFFLDRHWTVKKLSEFGNANMINLKLCLLVECNELKTIIDEGRDYKCESDVDERLVLGSLEYLGIYYMKNLRSVCNGPIVKGCLSKLKFLKFCTCTSLNSIFTPGLVGNLENLEELIVEDCPKIKSLVSHESTVVESTHFLPALKKMSLLELPELVSISSGLCIAPKLERLVIFYCPKLESLSTIDSKDLKVIKGESEWWDSLMWNESEWSKSSSYCQDYLASIFVPLRRERDLKAQLAMD